MSHKATVCAKIRTSCFYDRYKLILH